MSCLVTYCFYYHYGGVSNTLSHLMPCTCMHTPPHAFIISSQNDWVIMAVDDAAKMAQNSQRYNSIL